MTMRRNTGALALGLLLAVSICGKSYGAIRTPGETKIDPEEVRDTMKRVADWQLAHPIAFGPRHWVMAPLYEGLISSSLTTGDPKYLAAVIKAGRRIDWRPGPDTYHADDHAVGNAWLRIYLMDPDRDPELLQPFKDRFDEILAKPIREDLSFTDRPQTPGVEHTDRWTWSDALYMAPPTLGRLAEATGDKRYLEFVDMEFKATYDALFDPQEKLFYRDTRFIDQRTPNGEKVFWSRGHAWVYAGLPLLVEAIPSDYPTRAFYIDVFKEMSPAVLAAQQPDGLWYPSLKDPEHIPIGETSGTALFVYGLAWGVRNGVLDRETYWPAVERGWGALLTAISPEGSVGFVQPIGAEPEPFDAESQAPYGSGAVLGAGSEILRALDADAEIDPAVLFRKAERMASRLPDFWNADGNSGR
jgi:unsaturated rhamnogalacturonyl hydrolase